MSDPDSTLSSASLEKENDSVDNSTAPLLPPSPPAAGQLSLSSLPRPPPQAASASLMVPQHHVTASLPTLQQQLTESCGSLRTLDDTLKNRDMDASDRELAIKCTLEVADFFKKLNNTASPPSPASLDLSKIAGVMIRSDLYKGANFSVRAHVFENASETVAHNHGCRFISCCLSGKYVHQLHQVTKTDGKHFEAVRIKGGITTTPLQEPGTIENVLCQPFEAGQALFIHPAALHSVHVPDETSSTTLVTLTFKSNRATDKPTTFMVKDLGEYDEMRTEVKATLNVSDSEHARSAMIAGFQSFKASHESDDRLPPEPTQLALSRIETTLEQIQEGIGNLQVAATNSSSESWFDAGALVSFQQQPAYVEGRQVSGEDRFHEFKSLEHSSSGLQEHKLFMVRHYLGEFVSACVNTGTNGVMYIGVQEVTDSVNAKSAKVIGVDFEQHKYGDAEDTALAQGVLLRLSGEGDDVSGKGGGKGGGKSSFNHWHLVRPKGAADELDDSKRPNPSVDELALDDLTKRYSRKSAVKVVREIGDNQFEDTGKVVLKIFVDGDKDRYGPAPYICGFYDPVKREDYPQTLLINLLVDAAVKILENFRDDAQDWTAVWDRVFGTMNQSEMPTLPFDAIKNALVEFCAEVVIDQAFFDLEPTGKKGSKVAVLFKCIQKLFLGKKKVLDLGEIDRLEGLKKKKSTPPDLDNKIAEAKKKYSKLRSALKSMNLDNKIGTMPSTYDPANYYHEDPKKGPMGFSDPKKGGNKPIYYRRNFHGSKKEAFLNSVQLKAKWEELRDVNKMEIRRAETLSKLHPLQLEFRSKIDEKRGKREDGTFAFEGRKWLFEEVQDWLDNEVGNRTMMIVGDAGVGKSAFFAQLVDATMSHNVLAYHFCTVDEETTLTDSHFVNGLVASLIANVPDFMEKLAATLNIKLGQDEFHENSFKQIEEYVESKKLSAASYLKNLVLPALYKTVEPEDGKRLIVAVDSLDEGKAKVLDLVVAMDSSSKWPAWLRIFVTSRDDEEVKKKLRNAEMFTFNVIRTGDDNTGDLRRYVHGRIKAYYLLLGLWVVPLTIEDEG
mmetsp:Transcript_14671/g.27116  ORF Transcript_14671/g.27116 Transcript_14671/m.27116 type:complete len:1065 (-) Transcript_14671:102-3296(-)